MFKTDLQIAQECNMEHILKVAEKAGIPEEYVRARPHGHDLLRG